MSVELTLEQAQRLREFAAAHGPQWKARLRELWWSGKDDRERDGHLLRQVRNQVGPVKLDRVQL